MKKEENLESLVQRHTAFFDHMLTLIPSKHYFSKDSFESKVLSSKYHFNVKGTVSSKISATKKDAVKQNKRARLDPSQKKTILDIQSETKQKRDLGELESSDDDELDFEGSDSDLELSTSQPVKFTKNMNELKERLSEKIQSFRGKRKASDSINPPKPKKQKKEPANSTVGTKGGDEQTDSFIFSKFSSKSAPTSKESKGKSLKVLLKNAEKEKKQLANLPEEAKKEAEMKRLHDAALLRAQGQKVKNNPALLKKALKRKERTKAKSAAAWAERIQKQKEKQTQQQERRESNIKKFRGSNKGRAGFEGKKKTFINKNKKSH
eukprot:GCRY01002065.1.p1 GENE.GCRY01002065.1~~GCRY01002065.1.p1  ORF type:complete len:321 (+),score=59.49 GCRY01002065.1:146-1108(+)